jgi:hypothetical protein
MFQNTINATIFMDTDAWKQVFFIHRFNKKELAINVHPNT